MAGRKSRRLSCPSPLGSDQYDDCQPRPRAAPPNKAQQHCEIERWREFAHQQIESGCTPEIPCQVLVPRRKCPKKRCSRPRKKAVCREVEVWPPPRPVCPPRQVLYPSQCPPRQVLYPLQCPPPGQTIYTSQCPPTTCPPMPGCPQLMCLPLSQCPPAVRQAVTRDLPAASRLPKPLGFPVFSTRNPPGVCPPTNCDPYPQCPTNPGPDPRDTNFYHRRHHALQDCEDRYQKHLKSVPIPLPLPMPTPDMYGPLPDPDIYGCDEWVNSGYPRERSRHRKRSKYPPQQTRTEVNPGPSWYRPREVSPSLSASRPRARPKTRRRPAESNSPSEQRRPATAAVSTQWSATQIKISSVANPCNCANNGKDCKDVSCSCSSLCPPKTSAPIPKKMKDYRADEEENSSRRVNFEVYMALGVPSSGGKDKPTPVTPASEIGSSQNEDEGEERLPPITGSRSVRNLTSNLSAPNNNPDKNQPAKKSSPALLGSTGNTGSRTNLKVPSNSSLLASRSNYSLNMPPNDFRGGPDFPSMSSISTLTAASALDRSPRGTSRFQDPSPRGTRSVTFRPRTSEIDDDPYAEWRSKLKRRDQNTSEQSPRNLCNPPRNLSTGRPLPGARRSPSQQERIRINYRQEPDDDPYSDDEEVQQQPRRRPPNRNNEGNDPYLKQWKCHAHQLIEQGCVPPPPPPRCPPPLPRCQPVCQPQPQPVYQPQQCPPQPRPPYYPPGYYYCPRPCPPKKKRCPPVEPCIKPPRCRQPCCPEPRPQCRIKPRDKPSQDTSTSTNSSKPSKDSTNTSTDSAENCGPSNSCGCRNEQICCVRDKPCCCCKNNLKSKYGCGCCRPGPCCIPGPKAPCPCLRPRCGNQDNSCPCMCPCQKLPKINICVKPRPKPKPPMIICCEDTPSPAPPPPPQKCITRVIPPCYPSPCFPIPNPCFPCAPRFGCCPLPVCQPGQVIVQEIGACPDNFFENSKTPKDGSVNLRVPEGNRHNTCIKIAMSPEIQNLSSQNQGFVNSILRQLVGNSNPYG